MLFGYSCLCYTPATHFTVGMFWFWLLSATGPLTRGPIVNSILVVTERIVGGRMTKGFMLLMLIQKNPVLINGVPASDGREKNMSRTEDRSNQEKMNIEGAKGI